MTVHAHKDDVALQRAYYAAEAARYDGQHMQADNEHDFALAFMIGMLGYLGVRSILDVGSGTGRAISAVQAAQPTIKVVGIEPVAELRELAYKKGVDRATLIAGDARELEFPDGEFDLVCAFGVLHHVRSPEPVVNEMLRVAAKAVFISDSNNFGQGGLLSRSMKQALAALGLWTVADFLKTRGKGYLYSEGDGISYSYSVYSSLQQLRRSCRRVHQINTGDASGRDLYRSAGHVALLGIKSGREK